MSKSTQTRVVGIITSTKDVPTSFFFLKFDTVSYEG